KEEERKAFTRVIDADTKNLGGPVKNQQGKITAFLKTSYYANWANNQKELAKLEKKVRDQNADIDAALAWDLTAYELEAESWEDTNKKLADGNKRAEKAIDKANKEFAEANTQKTKALEEIKAAKDSQRDALAKLEQEVAKHKGQAKKLEEG